jgi:hypothetical protein
MTATPAIPTTLRSCLAGASALVCPSSFHARTPPNQRPCQAPRTDAENPPSAPRRLSQRRQLPDAPAPAAFTPWTRPQVR